MCQAINALEFANGAGPRYLQSHGDVYTCCWILEAGDNARVQLADVRRGGLPEVDNNGVLTPLAIPDTSGLAESTYIRFFPNQIVGIVFNHYGPKIHRFAYYLRARVGHDMPQAFNFEQLVRDDAIDRLNDMRRITEFTLRIRPAFIAELEAQDESLYRAFQNTHSVGEGKTIEISIQASRKRNATLGTRVKRIARSIARRARAGDDDVEKLVVRGAGLNERKPSTIDLLADDFLVTKQVELLDERTRALSPQSAFAAIQQAYDELRHELEHAAGIAEE